MKKRKKIGLTIGYLLSAIVIIFGTYLLVLLASGNSLDIFSGKIKPTGLILFDSDPDGGLVAVNGKQVKSKTPSRLNNVEPGPVGISIKKDGYRDWFANSSVKAGQVTFLTYAILFPEKINNQAVLSDLNIIQATQSQNHKRSFFVTGPNLQVISTDNFNSTNVVYNPAVFSINAVELKIISTSEDGSAVLISQKRNTGAVEYIYADGRGTRQAQNLTEQYRVSAGSLEFNPDNSNELFWLDGTSLRKINIDSKTTSATLADNIAYSKAVNTSIYYIQSSEIGKNLFSMDFDGNRKTLILSNIDDSPSYMITATKFNGSDYFALLVAKTHRLSIYKDTGSETAKTGDVLENVKDMNFSQNGRYLAIIQADSLITYDLEKNEFLGGTTTLTDRIAWQWYDDHHIIATSKSGVRMLDFDGQNNQIIAEGSDWQELPLVHNKNLVATRGVPTKLKSYEILIFEKH